VRFEELLQLGRTTAVRLARIVLDGTLGAQPPRPRWWTTSPTFDITDAQARTLYDTALSIYSRQVDQLHATGEPGELFYYAGPLDTKTRAVLPRAGRQGLHAPRQLERPTTGSCRTRC
jgi:hypothetical protein